MERAARSYLRAGIGIVGASAIALAPLSPVAPSDLRVPAAPLTSQVQLNASVNPLQVYLDLVQNTGENIGVLFQRVLENPAPILRQVLLNQLAIAEELLPALQEAGGALFDNLQNIAAPALQHAFESVLAGNFTAAANDVVTALFQPLVFAALPLLPALQVAVQAPIEGMLRVAGHFQEITALGTLALIAPFSSTIFSTGEALQNIADAASAGDLLGVAAAVIAAPGIVINGFLNGFGVDGGLFSGGLGTFNTLLNLRDVIANALKPPATTAAGTEALTEAEADTAALSDATAESSGAAARSAAYTSEESDGGSGGTPAAGVADTDDEDSEDSEASDEASDDVEDVTEDVTDEDAVEDVIDEEDAEEDAVTDEDEDVTEDIDDDLTDDLADDLADDEDAGEDTGPTDGNKATPGGTGSDETGSGSDDSGTSDDGGSDDSGSGGDSE